MQDKQIIIHLWSYLIILISSMMLFTKGVIEKDSFVGTLSVIVLSISLFMINITLPEELEDDDDY